MAVTYNLHVSVSCIIHLYMATLIPFEMHLYSMTGLWVVQQLHCIWANLGIMCMYAFFS